MKHKATVIGNGHRAFDLSAMLGKAGLDSIVVTGESWCGNELEKTLPDIVVVDEEATADGWLMCSEIRSEFLIPIVMVGNSDSESAWLKVDRYGVDYYAKWPIQPLELIARIRALLRRHEHHNHRITIS